MDVIVIPAALLALGVLAHRYGHDSRERPRSAEERRAAAGFRSAHRVARPAAAASVAPAPAGRVGAPAAQPARP